MGILRRVGYAMDDGVYYLLQDHLHSSSATVAQNGTLSGARNYFYPFGGNRGGAAFNGLTTKRFTGQYHEQAIPGGEGLSYYGARWYDAQLGRFACADLAIVKMSSRSVVGVGQPFPASLGAGPEAHVFGQMKIVVDMLLPLSSQHWAMMATAQRSVNSDTLVCVGASRRAWRGRSQPALAGMQPAPKSKQAWTDRPGL